MLPPENHVELRQGNADAVKLSGCLVTYACSQVSLAGETFTVSERFDSFLTLFRHVDERCVIRSEVVLHVRIFEGS